MPGRTNRERHAPVPAFSCALGSTRLAARSVLAGLALVPLQVWANPALQTGQVWSGNYRCAGISGHASLEVTRFEPIPERPGWQRIEATLTFEEAGKRGTARFAANNPTTAEGLGLSLVEWVEEPGGIELRRLQLQPVRDAGGIARIGVNVRGRPECVVNGVDTFSFMAEPARPDRVAAPAAAAQSPTDGPGSTGVEVFGIRLGAPLGWPRCQNDAWTGEPRNRPCAEIESWGVRFMFDRSTEPAMLAVGWGIAGERRGYLVNGRLERMTFPIWREDEHLQAFQEKFGTAEKELVQMHNDQGGRWIGFIQRWDVAGTVIAVDCTSFERVCSVEIETPVWQEQRQQDADRRQKL